MIEKRKKTVRSKDAKPGIDVDEKEIDIVLDSIISDISDCTQKMGEQTAENQTAEDLEKKKAEDVRKKAMESIGETRKHKSEGGEDDQDDEETETSFLNEYNGLSSR